MKKALVLGGAGFIGTALIQRLRTLGCQVTSVDRYWSSKIADVQCITGDVFDSSLLNEVMKDQDIVFHLVSTTVPASSNKSPVFDCETNVIGALRILDSMVKNSVRKIVFSSSGGTVYGVPNCHLIREDAPNYPISAYGIGKLTIEKYLYLYSQLHEIRATALRISNPFGPGQNPEKGQGAIAAFIYRAIKREKIEIWGDGSVVRDFIYIDDVIDALVLCEKLNEAFSVTNVGLGEGHSIREILSELQTFFDYPLNIEYLPGRSCDVPRVVLDISKAESELGWIPHHSFSNGLEKMVTDFKNEYR